MKYYGIYLICILFLCSCGDFLEYKDNDKVIPNKLEHYEELIFGEILKKNGGNVMCNLSLMTDDVTSFIKDKLSAFPSDKRLVDYGWYTWAVEPQYDKANEKRQDKAWAYFYHQVLMCNIVENEVSLLEEDQEGLQKRLTGEVQFMRALAYFYLVNMYAPPYVDEQQAAVTMGVPINSKTGIYDHVYTRSTLLEVYRLMEKDLLAAKKNLTEGQQKNSVFRPNLSAVNLILSRLYLFEGRYAEVIPLIDEIVLHSGAGVTPITFFEPYVYLWSPKNPGIFFAWGEGEFGTLYNNYDDGKYAPSADLTQLYGAGDVRPAGFFDSYSKNPSKLSTDMPRRCYRLEEALLNRAEAYIELGTDWEKGMNDINEIRVNRISTDWKISATDREDARRIYREERRRELCFEEIRWFDIRRWQQEVTHHYHEFNNPQAYKAFRLEKNSPNYTLPIPLDEQEVNTHIEQVKRVDCEVKS